MLEAVKSFLLTEDGGAVEWILTIIAGALIAAVAYGKLKGTPGNLGQSITNAGTNASNAVTNYMKE
ncbi:hypothetical protein [Desulfofundulus thermosubterraneus]|uniref:Uncharacterized protein n=1 Tax=Desulfofundulus thermosubterraneus DSM 16057 TaxID=1121432 RepID=A0A1M6H2E0_9FIRM|nr:hypothetical protein [Desulfofundulus thermosubterraneus]SHJ16304.1 hypothetical protein SAMN02745219_01897 [Desulfofundulus thermosubterraneus DSM 16057]